MAKFGLSAFIQVLKDGVLVLRDTRKINFKGSGVTVTNFDNERVDVEITGGGGGADVLNDLTDVTVPSPSNGEVLTFNSTSGEWEASSTAAGAPNFSYHLVSSALTVPTGQEMILTEPLTVDSDLTVDGIVTQLDRDLLKQNQSYKMIASGTSRRIYENEQNVVVGAMIVDGDLRVDGEIALI